jgi:hypothetical protein
MLRWLRHLKPSVQPKAAAVEENLPECSWEHAALESVLGEEGADEFERRLATYHREQDYTAQVELMERIAKLRRRELAARDELESLRY